MITRILDTERHMIEFLDIPNQLLLRLVSKSHWEFISQFKHLQKYINENVFVLPRSLINNIRFLKTHNVVNVQSHINPYSTSHYNAFAYIYQYKHIKTIPELKHIHPKLRYQLIRNHILGSRPLNVSFDKSRDQYIRGRLFCHKDHHYNLEPFKCETCKTVFEEIISTLTIDILHLIAPVFRVQFTKLATFRYIMASDDLELIEHVYHKYKDHYKKSSQLIIDRFTNSLTRTNINPVIGGMFHGIIHKNISPGIIELCEWIDSISTNKSEYANGPRYAFSKIIMNSNLNDYTIDLTQFNTDDLLEMAVYGHNIEAIKHIYDNSVHFNVNNLKEVAYDYYSSAIPDRSIHCQFESEYLAILNWLYDNGHPLDITNSEYITTSLKYLCPRIAQWFLSKGVAVNIDDHLAKYIMSSLYNCISSPKLMKEQTHSLEYYERTYSTLNVMWNITKERSSIDFDYADHDIACSLFHVIEFKSLIDCLVENGHECKNRDLIPENSIPFFYCC